MSINNDHALFYKKLSVVQNTCIQHPSFKKAATKVRESISFRTFTGKPKNLLLFGKPGVGKTTLRQMIEKEYPPVKKLDRVEFPVLSVVVPSAPTVKNVAEEILVACGDKQFGKGSSTDKTARIFNNIKEQAIKMIIFDETQHFVDGGNKNTPRVVADWLKVLIDESKVSTLLIGTEPVKQILKSNSQIRRRFPATIELKPFDISSVKSIKDFFGIIKIIDQSLGLPNELDIKNGTLIESIYYATDGVMDYVVKLLSQAYEIAWMEGKTRITRALLEEAFTEAIWSEGIGEMNPFNEKFIKKRLCYRSDMPFAA